jgi:hypothetical protein
MRRPYRTCYTTARDTTFGNLPTGVDDAKILVGEAARAVGVPKLRVAVGVAPQDAVFPGSGEIAGSCDLPA